MPLPRPTRSSHAALGAAAVPAALFLVGLGLAQPAAAQTLKAADLIGNWAKEGHKATYLTITDSTLSLVAGPTVIRWHLAGDTVVYDAVTTGSQQYVGGHRVVKLDGQHLTLTDPANNNVFKYVRATQAPSGFVANKPLTGQAIPCKNGLIKDFECENVELLSFIPRDSLAQSVGADMWGWHDSTTGREFAVLGGNSTAFVDVTDPLHPRYLGVLPPHQGVDPRAHAAQSVRVYGHYAFIGYEAVDHGIQVFDLAQLRDVKTPQEFKETAHYDGVANTHTITVNQETGLLTVNGSNTCGGGLHMLDVRSPTKPVHVGCYAEANTGRAGTGYVHDAQCVIYRGPDKRYTGREICVNYAETGISIADVTDKKSPKTISVATYPSVGYTHQGQFTEDQRYIYLDDEFDEGAIGHTRTVGFDLSKLDEPVVHTEFLNTTTETDHNLFIVGRYMYQGNYGAGLRIIDIKDPKNLKQVGYLANIGSAWGTYPFFKNNVIAVPADVGLFLVRQRSQNSH